MRPVLAVIMQLHPSWRQKSKRSPLQVNYDFCVQDGLAMATLISYVELRLKECTSLLTALVAMSDLVGASLGCLL